MTNAPVLPDFLAARGDRTRAATARGDRARARRAWAEAADAYAEAVRHSPDRASIWVQLGHMRKEAGDLPAAERAYGRALRLEPSNADTWLNAAYLLKALDRPLDAARAFERVSMLKPTTPGLADERELLTARGYAADGLAPVMADETAAPAPRQAVRRGGRLRARLAEAHGARDRRDWAAAATAFEAALELAPKRAALWVQLGHMRKEAGDLAGAETAYGRALRLEPDSADTWLNVGLLFKLMQRWLPAAEAYAEAARLGAEHGDPGAEVRALAARGVAPGPVPPIVGEWRHGKAHPSRRSTRAGLLDAVIGGPTRRKKAARAHVGEGDAARDRKDWGTAAKAYSAALAIDPTLAHIHVQLGHALKEGGRFGEAEAAYRQALRMEPDNGDTWLNLGHLLKLDGRGEEAVAAYRQAVEREPEREAWRDELLAALRATTARAPDPEPSEADVQAPAIAADPLLRLVRELGRGGSAARMVAALPPARVAELAEALDPQPAPARPSNVPARTPTPAPSASPDVWFDVSDLIGFFGHSRLPTGIQRVQIETVSAALREAPGGVAVGVCVFSEETSRWAAAPPHLFEELARLALLDADAHALNWRLALGRLELALTLAPPLEFRRGDILINLGAAWSQGNQYLALRAEKARSGVLYFPCVFDLIPVLAPGFHVEELAQAFLGWLRSVLAHADGVFCISRHTLDDLRRAAAMLESPLPGDREEVMPLDAQMSHDLEAPADPEVLRRLGLTPGGFVLFVSTVEPRKGHLTAFGAWEQLIAELGDRAPKLVCAGRLGWMREATTLRLQSSPALRDKVQIASGLSDRELHTLYKTCAFTLYASVYEGWGLPVTESLTYGKVPLTSDHPSVLEAGAGFAELFETGSERSLAAAASRLWTDTVHRGRAEQRIADGYRPRRWEDVAAQVVRTAWRWRDDASREVRAMAPLRLQLGRHYTLGRNIGVELTASASGEVFRRGGGWRQPEDWGCWSKPGDCMLAFSAPPTTAALRVFIGLRAPPPQGCRYRVLVAGETIGEGALAADAKRWFCRTLPKGAAASGEVTLLITSDAEWMIEHGPEPRLAGLGVTGLMVCEEGDLLARSAFMEEHMREELALLA